MSETIITVSSTGIALAIVDSDVAISVPQGAQGPQGPQGEQGIQGIQGIQGDPGTPGVGVPAGGTTAQVLSKASGTSYDTEWTAAPLLEGTNLWGTGYTNEFNGTVLLQGDSTSITSPLIVQPNGALPTVGQVLTAQDAIGTVVWTSNGSGTVTSITPAADNGSGTAITSSGTITVSGTASEITTSVTGTNITVGLPDAITVAEVNVGNLDFVTPLVPVDQVQRMYWDSAEGTLSLGLSANVQEKVGQSLFKRARNDSNTIPIAKGDVVYITGAQSNTRVRVLLATATSEIASADTIGVAAEAIAANGDGLIQVFGFLNGVTTNGYSGAEGSALYLSTTAGQMQSGLPLQPYHGVRMGFIVKKAGAGAGSIFVSIQNYQELEELSDVRISSPTNNDFLKWDSTLSVWKNSPVAPSNITQGSALDSQFLKWSGTSWTPSTPSPWELNTQFANDGDFIGFDAFEGVYLPLKVTPSLLGQQAATSGQCIAWNGAAWAPAARLTRTVNVQTFTGSGTWTKPAGAVSVAIKMSGGGGGGQFGTTTGAGAGGGAGEGISVTIAADYLGATEAVTIGSGGTGGIGAGVGGTPVAINLTLGNPSSFGTTEIKAYAFGGGAGNPVTSASFMTTKQDMPLLSASYWGSGGQTSGLTQGANGFYFSGGGGAGANALGAAGSSGGGTNLFAIVEGFSSRSPSRGGGAAGGATGATGAVGANGVVNGNQFASGAGGGGAPPNGATTAMGGNGGVGIRGSGGGGGGRGGSTAAGSNGGAGGNGFAIITTVCYT